MGLRVLLGVASIYMALVGLGFIFAPQAGCEFRSRLFMAKS
jgi:hypothetical protein